MEPLKVNLLVQNALQVCSKRRSLLKEFALQVDKTQGTAWKKGNVFYGTWILFLQEASRSPGSCISSAQTLTGVRTTKMSRKGTREKILCSTLPGRKQVNAQTPFRDWETWLYCQPDCCSPAGCPKRVCAVGSMSSGLHPALLPHITIPQHSHVLPDRCLPHPLLRTSGDGNALFSLSSPSQYFTVFLLKLFFLRI